MSSDLAVEIAGLGKCYNLYNRPADKVLDTFGLLRLFPWRRKKIQPFWALRDIDLAVRKGERIGLVGRNGAGKSTLLKLICGTVQATEGRLAVNGDLQALMEIGTAFHPEFSGRENIRASLAYQGYGPKQIAACEEEIEDFVELGPFMDQPVKTYSAGMYARLAFATATSIEPDILIIDEVLGAGDAYFASKCAARMKRLTQDSGATLLFVSHDISSVQQMCTRAIWLERGQIIMDGTPLDVGKAYYAETLRLEEERLKIQNQGAIGGSLTEAQPDVLLFRFVRSDFGPLQSAHPIRRLSLASSDKSHSLSVSVGAPMDNDPSQPASIFATPGSLWGTAEHCATNGYLRAVTATGGADNQAAFQFVGLSLAGRDDLVLEVEHAVDPIDPVAVEYYNGKEYVRLGLLEAGEIEGAAWLTQRFAVCPAAPVPLVTFADVVALPPAESTQDALREKERNEKENIGSEAMPAEKFYRIKQSVDKFASNYAEITSIEIHGKEGPRVVFASGEDFLLKIRARIHSQLKSAYLDICLYTPEDVVVYVGYWTLGDCLEPGEYAFEVVFKHPPLRQGEYIFSFALLNDFFAPGPTYFSEWNRTHHIKVNEDSFGKTMGLGLINLTTEPAYSSTLFCCKKNSSEMRLLEEQDCPPET